MHLKVPEILKHVELVIRCHVQVLVDCSGDDGTEKTPESAFLNKKSALLQLVEGSPVSRTIVFCNKVSLNIKCRKPMKHKEVFTLVFASSIMCRLRHVERLKMY